MSFELSTLLVAKLSILLVRWTIKAIKISITTDSMIRLARKMLLIDVTLLSKSARVVISFVVIRF